MHTHLFVLCQSAVFEEFIEFKMVAHDNSGTQAWGAKLKNVEIFLNR